MSEIIQKNYDPKKLIKRAVFKGSPNLFTTEDLNRQIESFQEQLDNLEALLGVRHSCKLQVSFDKSVSQNAQLTLEGGNLKCFGCEFSVIGAVKVIPVDPLYRGSIFVQVSFTDREVSYGDIDNSQSISGAYFSDGTSKPAASHLVYNEQVTTSMSKTEEQGKLTIFRVDFDSDGTFSVLDYGKWRGTLVSDAVSDTRFRRTMRKITRDLKELSTSTKKNFSADKENIAELSKTDSFWSRKTSFVHSGAYLEEYETPNAGYDRPSEGWQYKSCNVWAKIIDGILCINSGADYVELRTNSRQHWSGRTFIMSSLHEHHKVLHEYYKNSLHPTYSSKLHHGTNARMEVIHCLGFADMVLTKERAVEGVPNYEKINAKVAFGIVRVQENLGGTWTYAVGGMIYTWDYTSVSLSDWSVSKWEAMGRPSGGCAIQGFQLLIPYKKELKDHLEI